MNNEPRPHDAPGADHDAALHPHRWLSALADGDREAVDQACAMWRDDPRARRDWHLYHLIGDVLRSDELAAPPARDEAFLGRLRERLAAEPVPLAPAPLPAPERPARSRVRLGWRAPVAVAAGFVVVAGVLVLTRGPGFEAAGVPQLAVGPADPVAGPGLRPAGGTAVGNPARSSPPGAPVYVLDGALIRDANLEAYLRAHQDARRGAREVLPGGGLRHAELLVPQAGPAVAAAAPGGASRAASAAPR